MAIPAKVLCLYAVFLYNCNYTLMVVCCCLQVSSADQWLGGVSPTHCNAAPDIDVVLQHLQVVTAGRLLLGHGISKDLTALGLEHPKQLLFDTMAYPGFCNQAGNALNLKQLAKQFLKLDIQQDRPRAQQRKRRRKPPQPAHDSVEQQRQQDDRQPVSLRVSQEHDQRQQQQQQQKSSMTAALSQDGVAGPQAAGPQGSKHAGLTAMQQERQLKWLRQQQAVGEINRSGHDPEDDAVAVMKLYQQVGAGVKSSMLQKTLMYCPCRA